MSLELENIKKHGEGVFNEGFQTFKEEEKEINKNQNKIEEKEKNNENYDEEESKQKSTNLEKRLIPYDEMMTIVGEFGPLQLFIFIIFSIGMIIEAILVMSYVFISGYQDYYCVPEGLDHLNLTEQLKIEIATGSNSSAMVCQVYDRNYSSWNEETVEKWKKNKTLFETGKVPCGKWIYDHSTYQKTIIEEWNMVCGNDRSSLVYSIVGFGQFFGALFWGYSIDRFGRRKPYCIAVIAMVALYLISSYSSSFEMYSGIQFLMGFMTVASYSTGSTVAVEITGIKARGHLSTACNYFWSIGYMLLPGIAYNIRHWRNLQFWISVGSFVSLLLLLFIRESPRWFFSKNKIEKGEKLLKEIASSNKKSYPENVMVFVEEELNWSFIEVIKNPIVVIFTFILSFIWFSNSLLYFGISLFIPKMSEKPYLDFFISGAVEVPGYVVAQLSIAFLGRRKPLFIVMVTTGIILFIDLAILNKDIYWLSITLYLFGKFCVTSSWSIAICFTNEIYPTAIRGRGLFFCNLFGIVANILSAQIIRLSPGTICIIFGVIAISAGFTSLLLPETKGQPLSDTVEEMITKRKLYSFKEYKKQFLKTLFTC